MHEFNCLTGRQPSRIAYSGIPYSWHYVSPAWDYVFPHLNPAFVSLAVLHIAYIDTTHPLLNFQLQPYIYTCNVYFDSYLDELKVDLRRDREDEKYFPKKSGFFKVRDLVTLYEVQWFLKMVFGMKSVQKYQFYLQTMSMQNRWSMHDINIISLQK